jgi:putative endonuclease
MHIVYIIYSNYADKYYIGETADVENRLKLHNAGLFKSAFTKVASDWKIVFQYVCTDRSQALFLERFIKRMKNRKFIEKLIYEPEIVDDILKNKNCS